MEAYFDLKNTLEKSINSITLQYITQLIFDIHDIIKKVLLLEIDGDCKVYAAKFLTQWITLFSDSLIAFFKFILFY